MEWSRGLHNHCHHHHYHHHHHHHHLAQADLRAHEVRRAYPASVHTLLALIHAAWQLESGVVVIKIRMS